MSFRRASLLLLLVYGPLFAQTGNEPTFKGDHLGATVAEFVRRPAVAAMISKCKEVAPKLLTDAEVLKKYGKKAFLEIQASELRARANGTHAVGYYDTDSDAYLDRCGALSGILSKGNGTVNGLGYLPGNVYAMNLRKRQLDHAMAFAGVPSPLNLDDGSLFTFENGTLSFFELSISTSDTTYEDLRDDVTGRVGTTPKISTTPFQNGYGARWENITCVWSTPTIVVILKVDNNPVERGPNDLKVGSPAYMAKLLDAETHKPKPLDVP